jgi:hypothetical protein
MTGAQVKFGRFLAAGKQAPDRACRLLGQCCRLAAGAEGQFGILLDLDSVKIQLVQMLTPAAVSRFRGRASAPFFDRLSVA